jgi:gamma-glutamylcyclotransferase (GGCT)/AIG2-like uncharacterized protein YtfP
MRDDKRTHLDPIETGDLVFVYGTLRAGQSNDWLLGSSLAIGGIWKTVDRYRLMDLGAFPAAEHMTGEPRCACPECHSPGSTLVGEVYRVRANVGLDLDRLEGNGLLYRRAIRTVRRGDGANPIWTADELEFGSGAGWVRAWVFEIVRPRDGAPVIDSGDWFDSPGSRRRSCGECGHPMTESRSPWVFRCDTEDCPVGIVRD